MKKLIFASTLLLALFTGCDDYEDQFNINYELKDVKNLTMTLEASDYNSIASLSANKEFALSKDPEGETYLNALTAVGKNKYFTEDAPALWYLPAYIDSKYPNLDNGSKVSITYDNFENLPDYLKEFNAISAYDLTTADYKSVWGENISASFLSPSTIGKIPAILEESVKSPADGAMRLVNYAYSETEPSTGGGTGEPEVTYTSVSDVIATGIGNYNVKGEVVGTYAQGFVLNDGTGTILVYLKTTANYSVGDVVTVSGDVTTYNGLFQFGQNSTISFVERNATFAYPNSKSLTADYITAYVKNPTLEYVNFTGTLNISDSGKGYKYYNIIVEGTTIQGSISYPVDGVVDETLNGKEINVTGYAIGGTSKFINIMATTIAAADGSSVATTPIGVVALSPAGDCHIRGVVAATYAKGFLLTDGTGYILIYENKAPTVKEGEVVSVSGTTSKYAGLMQIQKNLEITKVADGTFKKPAVQTMTGADMDAYVAVPHISYVAYEGVLIIKDSGKGYNYYNVEVEGTESSQGGSISYPADDAIDATLNGKKVIVTGYAIGTSSGWVNTMITSVEAATAATNITTFGMTRAANPTPNASAVYRYDASAKAWKAYTTNAAKISVLQPDDYTTMGSTYVSKPDAMLPVYLQQTYPYAKNGDVMAVVYYSSSEKAISVDQYVYNDGWTKTTVAVPTLIVFLKSQNAWTEAKVYYASTFLSDGGEFTIQDVNLSGVQKVWAQDNKYGWKASAFANNTNYETESWIVSPEISLKKAAAPVLKFDEAHKFLNGAEPSKYLGVLVSTDYDGDVTKATWTELTVTGWSDGQTWDFVSVEPIDLTAYKDKTIRIAYRYKSDADAAATWEVKNMSVQE